MTTTSATAASSSYYDIDAILAEEELVPCTTLFDFSHLAHLDPDARHRETHLPEASQIKMPLWAVETWATLGFVRLSLPRHYSRKARERLEADPGDADLRKRNERFFLAGRMLVDLIEKSSIKVAKVIAKTRSTRRNAHTRALEHVMEEAAALKRTLLTSFAGERLRRTFDWALSSGGDDDVSNYLSKLTEMEQRLFYRGSSAVAAHEQWMMFGNRQLIAGPPPSRGLATPGPAQSSTRAVTPGEDDARHNDDDDDDDKSEAHRGKRRRLDQ